jgi:hypothetical protein
MDIAMRASYYLETADQRLGMADQQSEPERELAAAAAQAKAIQAVAAAVDRLAAALEARSG